MNKTFINMVGNIIAVPFIILEAIIKGVLLVGYFPTALILALIYPIIKDGNLNWVDSWYNYATTWKHGFYSGCIHRMWKG